MMFGIVIHQHPILGWQVLGYHRAGIPSGVAVQLKRHRPYGRTLN